MNIHDNSYSKTVIINSLEELDLLSNNQPSLLYDITSYIKPEDIKKIDNLEKAIADNIGSFITCKNWRRVILETDKVRKFVPYFEDDDACKTTEEKKEIQNLQAQEVAQAQETALKVSALSKRNTRIR